MIALVGSDGRIRYGGCATHQRPRPFDGRVVERAARLLATLIRFLKGAKPADLPGQLRADSSWSAISRRQSRWDLRFPQQCSPAARQLRNAEEIERALNRGR